MTARPLTPAQQEQINDALHGKLARLFFGQRHEDQRHGHEVASRIKYDPTLLQAALLHDVGKSACDLGAIGRSLATIWSASSLPIWGQWRTYAEHGPIGASLLEANGADELAVAFTRDHPGPVPEGIDPDAWRMLATADDA
ncbi:MAG: hypothetical protein M3132_12290 [Actinomycetia bacterium]|nr:hypothetical protein [Actinomycetes bacterium]